MPGYNLAFDNVHAVEFSRIGRSPDPTITVRPEGQLLNLTRFAVPVKSALPDLRSGAQPMTAIHEVGLSILDASARTLK